MKRLRFSHVLFLFSLVILAACGGKEKETEVQSIAISQPSAELTVGETLSLEATVSPSNATYDEIIWTSTMPKVASVTNSGLVSALSEGNTTITAMAGGKTASCSITVKNGSVAVESVELNKTELTLVEGNTETLTATVKPDDATDKSVSWKSSDNSIATVDNKGKVTAVSAGEATITATAGEKSASCKVVVQKKDIPVTSISLNEESIELQEGKTATLTATVLPDDATDKTVTWKSSKPSVATVENGVITALAVGETTISASAGDKTATCKVTVKPKAVASSLEFSTSSLNGNIDKDYAVSVNLKPADAPYDLEWTSSNPRVADVQGKGLSAKIHTKDFGTAIITVTDKISGKSASITILTNVTDFEWKESTGNTYSGYPLITISEGEEYQLHFSCSPSSATHLFEDLSNFVFYESNTIVDSPSFITIDPDGKVKGVKPGTVGIKPTGLIKGTTGRDRVYITVTGDAVPATEICLDKTSITLSVGKAEAITATILPENATNQTVTWTSSNTSVAKVNANGTVKGISAGTAIITATVDGVTAECSVTVTVPVESVSLNKTSLTLAKGKSETLKATVSPTNATNKNVTWTSSNTSVATVSSSGKVTAVAVGTAQITVTTKDGYKKATCTVTVTSGSTGPKGYKVFIKHGAEFKYSSIPGEGTYKGSAFTSPNTKYNYSGDNHELIVSSSSTEVKNMLKELGMSEQQFMNNYITDDPIFFIKKNSAGANVEPGDLPDTGSNDNLYQLPVGDISAIYGSGVSIYLISPSNWNEFSIDTALILDPEVSKGGPHFVYVVYMAKDNTKHVNVVVKFVYNVK